jgi:hypothetical protein
MLSRRDSKILLRFPKRHRYIGKRLQDDLKHSQCAGHEILVALAVSWKKLVSMKEVVADAPRSPNQVGRRFSQELAARLSKIRSPNKLSARQLDSDKTADAVRWGRVRSKFGSDNIVAVRARRIKWLRATADVKIRCFLWSPNPTRQLLKPLRCVKDRGGTTYKPRECDCY